MRIVILLALLAAITTSAVGQKPAVPSRAQEIAAAFNKHKSLVKEKYGVRVEKYKDVRSEPAVKQNISKYSGRYEVSELGYGIDIQVGGDGAVHASMYESGEQFKLENAMIEGALFTATKVYHDGRREKFEGVFLNRTDRNSPTDKGVTIFGLGVLLSSPVEFGGNTYDKLFYQMK